MLSDRHMTLNIQNAQRFLPSQRVMYRLDEIGRRARHRGRLELKLLKMAATASKAEQNVLKMLFVLQYSGNIQLVYLEGLV